MKITIYRTDYRKAEYDGYRVSTPVLPSVESASEITDSREVSGIHIEFDTEEERDDFVSKFPKYVGWRKGSQIYPSKSLRLPTARLSVFQNRQDDIVGSFNEAAVKRAKRAIEVMKELGL